MLSAGKIRFALPLYANSNRKELMKNALFIIVMAALMAGLSSCGSTFKLVADESSPAEQNAVITFANGDGWFSVKEWNGINIQEILYTKYWRTRNDRALLTLPAGTSTITSDVSYTFSNRYSSTTYHMEDFELKYNLEAGKNYEVRGVSKSLGMFKGYELGVRIYDVTERKSELLFEWTLGTTADWRS